MQLADRVRRQLAHRSVLLVLRVAIAALRAGEILLDQQAPAHFVIVSVEPGALIQAQVMSEILARVQRGQACELLILDF